MKYTLGLGMVVGGTTLLPGARLRMADGDADGFRYSALLGSTKLCSAGHNENVKMSIDI